MINLVRVRQIDCERVFRLTNDPTVRAVSFQSEPVAWQTHVEWFQRQIQDPGRLFFLGFESGAPLDEETFVGQVRFRPLDHQELEVSISLTKAFRGKGWGRRLLAAALDRVRDETTFERIRAGIKSDNLVSVGFFASFGFKPLENEPGTATTMLLSLERKGTKAMDGKTTFIIAELSANHGHRLETALETVRAAKKAGADAIKIQTYTADTITLNSNKAPFQIKQGTIWDGTTLYKLYQQAYTPWEWHEAIRDEAAKEGLTFFSTPFDPTAVDFLEQVGVPIYKIASFEINDIPLIEYAASKGKPMIISTGIADLAMIEDAVNACRRVGNDDITLLKCTSSYPAPVEEANLLTLPNLRDTFGVRVGLSDHTMGSAVALAAVALGARVVEKHFIVDRSVGGPDASFSMEPAEFKLMVEGIRMVEKALGTITYEVTPKVLASRNFSRSLFAVKKIAKGEALTAINVRSIRPAGGLAPKFLPQVLGKKATTDIDEGTPLAWDLIQ